MKIRQGFVSNSSSSSFVLFFPKEIGTPQELLAEMSPLFDSECRDHLYVAKSIFGVMRFAGQVSDAESVLGIFEKAKVYPRIWVDLTPSNISPRYADVLYTPYKEMKNAAAYVMDLACGKIKSVDPTAYSEACEKSKKAEAEYDDSVEKATLEVLAPELSKSLSGYVAYSIRLDDNGSIGDGADQCDLLGEETLWRIPHLRQDNH